MTKNSQQIISFTKMHGLGNDFAVVNAINQSFNIKNWPIVHMADRHQGIGFDQLLIIEKSERADFFCRIFNADGSEAEQCGNGLRCIARFIHEEKLNNKPTLHIETKAGIYPLIIHNNDLISVVMGIPIIQENLTELQLKNNKITLSVLSLGNPHAIVKVNEFAKEMTQQLGREIATHSYFKEGANVGFMQVVNPNHILLRTYERGVGETKACGSNACAAVAAGIANGWLKHHVRVEVSCGSLEIEWMGKDNPLEMKGPAVTVYSGKIVI